MKAVADEFILPHMTPKGYSADMDPELLPSSVDCTSTGVIGESMSSSTGGGPQSNRCILVLAVVGAAALPAIRVESKHSYG